MNYVSAVSAHVARASLFDTSGHEKMSRRLPVALGALFRTARGARGTVYTARMPPAAAAACTGGMVVVVQEAGRLLLKSGSSFELLGKISIFPSYNAQHT